VTAVLIGLKIPDNTAYTALVALRKLGVDVERVERGDVYLFDADGDVGALEARIVADERIYNPNKHRLTILERSAPRPGEVWIEPLAPVTRGAAAVAWRLFGADGTPVNSGVLDAAIERLLCNPAVEKAIRGKAHRTRDK
jgi:phosphoribosylformylglycinamidine (FGAM) synthase PurS component